MKRPHLIIAMLFALIKLNAQTKDKLEVVTELDVRPGNVAVSKTGRVFTSLHPLGSSRLQLIEVKGNNNYSSYPSDAYQKNGGNASEDTFDTPLGITFDADGKLWVIDMGQTLGKTRLWSIDINANKVLRKIELSQDIAPKGSFIQDLAIDSKNGWAYLADIANPGIIAVDLKTEKARRFNYQQFQSENIDMIIDGKVIYFGGSPARVGVNPITLSSDANVLYFGAMNGLSWYSLDATLIRTGKPDDVIEKRIKKVGSKPISDGTATDKKGNHYFTNLPEHAVTKLDTNGKLSNLIQDNRIDWSDNLSLGPDDYIYIVVNQLHKSPAFTGGKDEGSAPYYIYRFKYKID